jgi:hypothetical protein
MMDDLLAEAMRLDALYVAAEEHDRRTGAYDLPEEYEDPSDYMGMGWIGRDGQP